ncbi:hypothetical protein JJQ59_27930 [Cupriavidus necator]|nr:hypothetical protein [Cupriavidus necator]QQX86603.1 hypothetical protein JJQ59_27930 [Cupriavidus necator]
MIPTPWFGGRQWPAGWMHPKMPTDFFQTFVFVSEARIENEYFPTIEK